MRAYAAFSSESISAFRLIEATMHMVTSFLCHPVDTFAYQFLISDRIGIAKISILLHHEVKRLP